MLEGRVYKNILVGITTLGVLGGLLFFSVDSAKAAYPTIVTGEGSGQSTQVTPNYGSPSAGDYLIYTATGDNNSADTPTPPSGQCWTEVGSWQGTYVIWYFGGSIWYKQWGQGCTDDSTPTFTYSPTINYAYSIARVSGADSTSTAFIETNSNIVNPPSASAGSTQDLLAVVASGSAGYTSATDYEYGPSGYSVDYNNPAKANLSTITASKTTTASSEDPANVGYYDEPYGQRTGAATMLFWSSATPGVTLSKTSGSVTEGGAGDSYTIVLDSEPAYGVIISIGAPDADYTISPPERSITFTTGNWDTPQTITLSAVDDDINETSPENKTINHAAASSDPDYNAIPVDNFSLNVIDDDVPGVSLSKTNATTTEGGASDTYTIVLDSEPTGNVDITINGGDADYTRTPSSMTFTSGNWDTPQTATTTAIDDDINETSPENKTITHTSSSTDSDYNGASISNVSLNVIDDDVPGVTVSEASVGVTEGGATSTYTVVLDSEPTDTVTITVTGDSEAGVNPSPLTFLTSTWDTPQTVTVTAVNDEDSEGTHYATSTHSASSNDGDYDGISINSVGITITDNDFIDVYVIEGGATDDYSIVLGTEPTDTVYVIPAADAEATTSESLLTFLTSTWDTPQNVTVTATDDEDEEGSPHYGYITHTASSTDPKYDGIEIGVVRANITDNDGQAVTGYLESATFDTRATDGFIINSIVWNGSQPTGTEVGFQIGVSSSTASSTFEFLGTGCSGAANYDSNGAGVPISVDSACHHPYESGYRYFRYRVYLDRNEIETSPSVSRININWSP